MKRALREPKDFTRGNSAGAIRSCTAWPKRSPAPSTIRVDVSAMFCDHIAWLFLRTSFRAMAVSPSSAFTRGGLPPWQLRRAYEFIDAHLGADLPIAEVAAQCGLSSSYFAHALNARPVFAASLADEATRGARQGPVQEPDRPLAEIAHNAALPTKAISRGSSSKSRVAARDAGGASVALSL